MQELNGIILSGECHIVQLEALIQPAILLTGVVGAVLNARKIIFGFHIGLSANIKRDALLNTSAELFVSMQP